MTVFLVDPDLLQRFRRGDRTALAHVYAHYAGAVESLLRAYIVAGARHSTAHRVILRADLADLVQEVFIKAFGKAARLAYDGVREYRPFLVALSRNALIDHLRSRRREVPMDVAAIERLGDHAPPAPPEDVPWADANTMLLVEGYLGSLSSAERGVYVERYVHCRSQIEAATALGLSRQQLRTMEVHLRRGLARELNRANLYASTLRPGASALVLGEPDHGPVAAQPERSR